MQLLHKDPLAKMRVPFDFSTFLASVGHVPVTYSTLSDSGLAIDESVVADDVVTVVIRGGAEGGLYNFSVIASGSFGNYSITNRVFCAAL